jgi:zinc protease
MGGVMKKLFYLPAIILFLIVGNFFVLRAQDGKINYAEKIKNDDRVVTGKLDNGLTYYIRKNNKPEKRAELRLAVNAGSILEDDDQLGLAHFCEHMAFNGTKNFKKQEIINFLEGIGVRFGPELNAYTSFDETVYMLQIPTDKKDILEKGFQVLGDWACNVSYENEEIDKERGVIVEEWRLGRGANARIRDKQFPVVLKDSHYAERLVIGKKEIIESFKYETIKRFYKDWYRPDLMAVVAVGDFDVNEIEGVIKKIFGSIPAAQNPRPRKIYDVPSFKETLYSIESDKELSYAMTTVLFKRPPYSTITLKDYKEDVLSSIFSGIMSERLNEKRLLPDATFVNAYIGAGSRYTRTVSPSTVQVVPKNNNITGALKSVMVELDRAKKFGFTATELERNKKSYLRNLEINVKEQDKKESNTVVNRIIENYLMGESYPSENTNYELGLKIIPTITVNDINEYVKREFPDENIVVTAAVPEKADIVKPTKEILEKVIQEAANEKIEPYVDKTLNEDLIAFEIKPGKIVSEKTDVKNGVTELRLSNGAKVVLKPTSFKNDELLYTAFSDGGTSLCNDKDYLSATLSSTIVSQSGAGKFSRPALVKYLSDKVANIYPSIGMYSEGLNGSASIKDMETFFKLNYLYFTQPRKDSASFKSTMAMLETSLKNRSSSPEMAFSDTVSVTLGNYHFRRMPVTADRLKEVDYETAMKFYKERFADAGDFTFVFVGSFELNTIKPFIEKYIASLPSLNRNEKWKDVGIAYPKGVIKKEVKKGIEPKSKVQIYYTGEAQWSEKEAYNLQALTDALNIKLREVIREDKGGTYGIGIYGYISRIPKGSYYITTSFGCKPERAEELSNTALAQIDSVINYPIKDTYVNKVKETQMKTLEKELKENNSWLNWLRSAYSDNVELKEVINSQENINTITAAMLQETAKKYFNKDNFIKVVLYPEK